MLSIVNIWPCCSCRLPMLCFNKPPDIPHPTLPSLSHIELGKMRITCLCRAPGTEPFPPEGFVSLQLLRLIEAAGDKHSYPNSWPTRPERRDHFHLCVFLPMRLILSLSARVTHEGTQRHKKGEEFRKGRRCGWGIDRCYPARNTATIRACPHSAGWSGQAVVRTTLTETKPGLKPEQQSQKFPDLRKNHDQSHCMIHGSTHWGSPKTLGSSTSTINSNWVLD